MATQALDDYSEHLVLARRALTACESALNDQKWDLARLKADDAKHHAGKIEDWCVRRGRNRAEPPG